MRTKKVLSVPRPATLSEDRVRHRILSAGREQFLKFGYGRVTMDEIASLAGIGKATLYKYFSTKEQLLRIIVLEALARIEQGVAAISADRSKDFVVKLSGLLEFVGLSLAEMGELLSPDIQRNAPEVWQEVEEFRKSRILSRLKTILGEGIRAGAFRDDFNLDFLVLAYSTLVQSVMNPSTLVQFSLSLGEAFETIIGIVLEGILTDKARAGYLMDARSGRRARRERP